MVVTKVLIEDVAVVGEQGGWRERERQNRVGHIWRVTRSQRGDTWIGDPGVGNIDDAEVRQISIADRGENDLWIVFGAASIWEIPDDLRHDLWRGEQSGCPDLGRHLKRAMPTRGEPHGILDQHVGVDDHRTLKHPDQGQSRWIRAKHHVDEGRSVRRFQRTEGWLVHCPGRIPLRDATAGRPPTALPARPGNKGLRLTLRVWARADRESPVYVSGDRRWRVGSRLVSGS